MRFSAVKTVKSSRAEGGASFGGREGGASSTAFKAKAEEAENGQEEGVAGESGSDEDEDQEEDGTEGNGLGLCKAQRE